MTVLAFLSFFHLLEFFTFFLPFFIFHFSGYRWCVDNAFIKGRLRNEQYSLLAVMCELSTVRCDHVLGLWLQEHGRRVSTVSCRGGAQAGRQLWRPLLDRGRKRRLKAGFLICTTKPRRRTAVEDSKL